MSAERYYSLDAMRAVLMMLGVVLHTADIYTPGFEWLISSHERIELAAALHHGIHLFRMPAFFVVSGFFCLLTLQKYGPATFVNIRLKRIIIPFVCAALILNSIQTVVLNYYVEQWSGLSSYLLNGQYISHLWFLINLVFYFVISVFAISFLRPLFAAITRIANKIFQITPLIAMLLILPMVDVAILALNKTGFPLYETYFGLINVLNLVSYFPYFLFGMLMAQNRQLLTRFNNIPISISLLILVCAVSAFINILNLENPGVVYTALETYAHGVMVWSSIALCFTGFTRFFNQPSRLWRRLSDASYTVYLFHHILVICLGLVCLHFSVGAYIALPGMILIILCITLALHFYVIERFSVLRYMFNGRKQ